MWEVEAEGEGPVSGSYVLGTTVNSGTPSMARGGFPVFTHCLCHVLASSAGQMIHRCKFRLHIGEKDMSLTLIPSETCSGESVGCGTPIPVEWQGVSLYKW